MNIPELFNSLTIQRFKLTVDGDDIIVDGPGNLSSEQQDALLQNKVAIVSLLRPVTATEEDAERESIQFADTPEAVGLGDKVGDEFLAMVEVDRNEWGKLYSRISKRVAQIDTLLELAKFEVLFRTEMQTCSSHRAIEQKVQSLMNFQRRYIELNFGGPTVQVDTRSCDTGESGSQDSRQVDEKPESSYIKEANGPGASTPEPF